MPICTTRFIIKKGQQRGDSFPSGLKQNGPVVELEVAVPSSLAEYLTKEKLPVPQPVKGLALFDTGATISAVDSQVLDQLGVKPIGVVTVLIAGGPQNQNCYPARFIFRQPELFFEFGFVLGANLKKQSVMGRDLIALIGRDLLARTVFVYDGINAICTVAF